MSKKAHPPAHKSRTQTKRFPAWAVITAIVVLIAVVFAAIVLTQPKAAEALPPDISVSQAASLRNAGAFLLDVREPSEWQDFHVPGATLIPLGSLESRLSEVPKDKDVVVVCRSGNRSKQGRDILLKAGFTRVASMTGGLTDWRSQGLPTVSGQ